MNLSNPASRAQACQAIGSLERTSSLLVNEWFSVKTTRFLAVPPCAGNDEPIAAEEGNGSSNFLSAVITNLFLYCFSIDV